MSDEFTAKPSLISAMFANPLKTLLVLTGVYATGAVIGKKKSVRVTKDVASRISTGISTGIDFTKSKLEERKGSQNVIEASELHNLLGYDR